LDYHIIKQEQKNTALEKHREEIDERDNSKEADKNEVSTPSMMSKDRRQQLIDAHILCANDIFKKNLAEDEIMTKFLILPGYEDILHNTDDEIRDKIETFIELMLKLHDKKKKTIVYWTEILTEGEREAEKKSIELNNEFKHRRNQEHKKINWRDPSDMELDLFERWVHQEVDVIEDNLMAVEMKLVEAIGIATSDFSKEVDAINAEMTTESQKFHSNVQGDVDKFNSDLREVAYKLNEEITKEDDDKNVVVNSDLDDAEVVTL
jgi:hypothetical protein